MQNNMRVLFTGGATLGPVTPLLAVAEEVKKFTVHGAQFTEMLWVGTRKGPERKLVEEAGISFSWIWAPKLRRYFDVRNFFAPLALHLATKIAWFRLLRMRPDAIVTAGGFVGVPVVWAAWWLRMFGIRIPVLLHNQDVRWSLANKLVAPFVKRITCALPDTVPVRWKRKSVWTGNPVRALVLQGNKARGLKMCGFSDRLPTIMVVGGGTGAMRLNEIVVEALPELVKKFQVIHITGRGKSQITNHKSQTNPKFEITNYCCFEFVTSEMGDLLAASDVVVTRAGMGVLTELAALGKPMVIVPIPGTHQEDNARYFAKKGGAVVLDQDGLSGKKFVSAFENLFGQLGVMQEMGERGKELSRLDSARAVADEVYGLAKK